MQYDPPMKAGISQSNLGSIGGGFSETLEIPKALEDIKILLENLHAVAYDLEQRLTPVSCPAPDTKEVGATPRSCPQSPLGQELDGVGYSMRNLSFRLSTMLLRLTI